MAFIAWSQAVSEHFCSAELGVAATANEKPPVFRRGKRVVCAIELPDGTDHTVAIVAIVRN